MHNPQHKYKIIFLLISSDDQDIYKFFKQCHPKYMQLFSQEIKLFFVEFREDMDQEVMEDGNTIYVRGKEFNIPGIFAGIPGIYQKSMRAMEHINANYQYEYLIRGNLSTLWNIPNLFSFLSTKPSNRFAGGFHPSQEYSISGTGIIMSRDVCVDMINRYLPTLYTEINLCDTDDGHISKNIISMGIPLYQITEYKWGFLISDINAQYKSNERPIDIYDENDNYSDILNFRIKHDNRVIDAYCYRVLLQRIYGIET